MSAGVIVRVPASTSNLGAGFDCVGLAVDRWLIASVRADAAPRGRLTIQRGGTLRDLAISPETDRLYVGFLAACRAAGRRVPPGLTIEARSEIPIGRGLGSSAAATVAGAVAANTLLDLGLGESAVTLLCAGIEGHADNVVPAVYGGAKLVIHCSPDTFTVARLDVHESLAFVFAVPDFAVETARARAALPTLIPQGRAAAAAARAAALATGLARGDGALLREGLDDVLHVPYRRSLVPGYDSVTLAARAAGAFGATLSGSGSAIVAITLDSRAPAVARAMAKAWGDQRVAAETFQLRRPAGGYQATLQSFDRDERCVRSGAGRRSPGPGGSHMSVTVNLPTVLAKLAEGLRSIEASGQTVGDIVAEIAARYPELGPRLRDEQGNPYPFVTFYLNDEDIRFKGGFRAAVKDGDEVTVVPAIAGGSTHEHPKSGATRAVNRRNTCGCRAAKQS